MEGEWSGQRFILADWQRLAVREFFGWKRKDSRSPEHCTRQYRSLWIEVPRKNGKSLFCAALALLLLIHDGEKGAQIFSAAADKDQANIVFDVALQMRSNDPDLTAACSHYGGETSRTRSIVYKNSFYRAMSSQPQGKHGLNIHAFICDEVHEQTGRDLLDTLRSAQGARNQPARIYATTAGHDRNSICWELHSLAVDVIANSYNRNKGRRDEEFLPFVFGADMADDWTDPRVWAIANPNLGISPKIDFIAKECEDAKNSPAYENTFRRLYLNQWTEQANRWLTMRRWNRCGDEHPQGFGDRRCWGGLDLASTTDIAAYVLVFEPDDEGRIDVLSWFWVPSATLHERAKLGVPYDVWTANGLMNATEGDLIDFDVIRRDIVESAETYNVQEVGYDRWNATQLTTQLDGDGLTMVPIGQGYASMSAPSKQFELAIRKREIRHGGHKVLDWMAGNVAIETDAAGNIKPSKRRSAEKIDGIVAAVMGFARMFIARDDEGLDFGSDYEVGV